MPGDTLILTDSCCDVPQYLAKKLGIRKIPVHVMYPEKDYLDGIDIDPQMVYDRFPGEIPTTSTPSITEITDLFRSLEEEGIRKVLSIHISEHLSSTVNMVRSVAKEFPSIRTFVFDTKNISIGSGIYALYAAKRLNDGDDFDAVCESLERKKQDCSLMFYMDSLEYLHKGGRIGNVTYFLSDQLKIKPIIACDSEGIYRTVAKVRGGSHCGRARLFEEVFSQVENGTDDDVPCDIIIPYGGAKEEAQLLEEMIRSKKKNANVLFQMQITASMAVHTGPGLLGLCALRRD